MEAAEPRVDRIYSMLLHLKAISAHKDSNMKVVPGNDASFSVAADPSHRVCLSTEVKAVNSKGMT